MDFFKKQINSDTESQIEFLQKHFRYYTANSWNRMTSYAHCAKLHSLGVPASLDDKAWSFLDAECNEYNLDVSGAIHDFYDDTGYWAGFNGRSCGYIVMYDTEVRDDKTVHVMSRPIDEDEDFDEWDTDRLVERVRLVQRFDQLCDEIRDIFLYYVENTVVQEEVYTVEKTRTIARLVESV